jgi:hypothetical protein
VRSGDYIVALIRESQDLNEYAFALGALAHYAADNSGHSHRVNVTVPLLLPQAARRSIGKIVTYADDPARALQDRIRLRCVSGIARPLRARRVQGLHRLRGRQAGHGACPSSKTYGMKLRTGLSLNVDLAIGSYRRAVGTVLPPLTKARLADQ